MALTGNNDDSLNGPGGDWPTAGPAGRHGAERVGGMTKIGPYELNSIHCGECSEFMAQLPDACIDLTVTSPPYDNLRQYNGYTFPFEQIAQQLYRVTKPGGVVVWVVGDATIDGSETLTSFRQALYFRGLGFWLFDTMIWQKPNAPIPTQDRYYDSFEYMFVFSKGRPAKLNLLEDKPNKKAGQRDYKDTVINKGAKSSPNTEKYITKEYGRRFNVWNVPVGNIGNDDFYCVARFPEALAHDHIISWSNPGDIVLDPMMGSGTTAKMAAITGRHYLGFDISPEYCDLARRRVGEVEREQRREWKQIQDNGKLDDLPMFAQQGLTSG